MPRTWSAGRRVAAISKAGSRMVAISARERVWRYSGGRNGLGQNTASAGFPEPVAAGILACRRTGLPARRKTRGSCDALEKFGGQPTYHAGSGRQDAALYGRHGCPPLRTALDRLPHEPRLQLDGGGKKVYTRVESLGT